MKCYGSSIIGVGIGLILFLLSFVLLFWNEGRAVHRSKALREGASAVVAVDSKVLNPANEKRLVYFTGDTSGKKLEDPAFGITQVGVRLRRVAEMYQWKETKETETQKDRIGGGSSTKTTYTYSLVWNEQPIDSSRFTHEAGHENSPTMRVRSETWTADPVTVGAFTIPPDLVKEIDNERAVPIDEWSLAGVSAALRPDTMLSNGGFYIRPGGGASAGATPAAQVGDVRVTFKVAPEGPVSVIAGQRGQTLDPYEASTDTLFLLYTGVKSANEMFQAEQQKNTIMTWILRVVGVVVMWIGMALVLNPLKVIADVIGIVGDIVGVGIGLATLVMAATLSTATIAVAWLFYRPLAGLGLLALAGGGTWLFIRLRNRARDRRLAAAPGGAGLSNSPLPQS